MQNAEAKKVVIVDDSQAIRGWLRLLFARDKRLTIVGEAGDAQEARKIIKETAPDVITLDVAMPGMNGLQFLEKLMSLHPIPVVMIASDTHRNSDASVRALSLGAVDCILKPTALADEAFILDLSRRVFAAACSNVQALPQPTRRAVARMSNAAQRDLPIILMGASTGGIAAIEVVLSSLDAEGPPVVIVQHMPGTFLIGFAKHLNNKLPQDVRLAREGEVLTRGMVRLAPAMGQHTGVQKCDQMWCCVFLNKEENALHCPSVDRLFKSAYAYAPQVIAVILTGLGRDGAAALYDLRYAGSTTIGQDAASSVVYGMPRAAWDIGAVQKQCPVSDIGSVINAAVSPRQNQHRRTKV